MPAKKSKSKAGKSKGADIPKARRKFNGKQYTRMTKGGYKTKRDAGKAKKRFEKQGKTVVVTKSFGKYHAYARAKPKTVKPTGYYTKASVKRRRKPKSQYRKTDSRGVKYKKGDKRRRNAVDKGKNGGPQRRWDDPWAHNKELDKREKAMYPGDRKASVGTGRANQYGPSKGGNYYENRINRSDKDKKKRY